ncbi:MAG: dynamin family protein [Cyanobacteria bacterium P01_A01_bin.45]
MQNQEDYKQLINTLKAVSELLNLDKESSLNQDIATICNHLVNPNFRIAVFGPFNHGKSTLLNAILGSKALPIDLIPTTGAAITVKHGSDIYTRITLNDGSKIYRAGTNILKEYAILDDNRRMRNDVTSVELFCPHPFLSTGVEFLDLPGTNDREAQDKLVKEQLLSADLVVQLLDARKVMTLGERENLRDWLSDRGIKTVIFVVNFLNLLEPEEQKEVQSRLRFVAQSFRADLPPGFSNLYRVDALPALRARLKGDTASANTSGLVAFETALQNIVGILQKDKGGVSSSRVNVVSSGVQQALKAKITEIRSEIDVLDRKDKAKDDIKRKAEGLIRKGFEQSLSELRNWLTLHKLCDRYQSDATVELARGDFKTWEKETLKKDLSQLHLDIVKWLYQAYDFFQSARPEDLSVSFPKEPQIELPPQSEKFLDDSLSDPGSLAVGGGIGLLLAGPVGAAVVGSIAYILNKNIQQQGESQSGESYHQKVAQLCLDAVEGYLQEFRSSCLSLVNELEKQADRVIKFIPDNHDSAEVIHKHEELRNLQLHLQQLNQGLEKTLGISTPQEFQVEVDEPKSKSNFNQTEKQQQKQQQTVYRFSGKGVREEAGIPRKSDDTSAKGKDSNPKDSSTHTVNNSQTKNSEERDRTETKTDSSWEFPGYSTFSGYVSDYVNDFINKKANVSPPPDFEIENKFRDWEINQEMEEMKANMYSSGYKSKKSQGQSNKQASKNKQVDKNQIARAYSHLGLKAGASSAEIKQAYKKLVKKWHPDLYVAQPQMQKQAEQRMRLINEAYNILNEDG